MAECYEDRTEEWGAGGAVGLNELDAVAHEDHGLRLWKDDLLKEQVIDLVLQSGDTIVMLCQFFHERT